MKAMTQMLILISYIIQSITADYVIDAEYPLQYSYANITCPSGVDCTINCVANMSCYGAVIDGSAATNLKVDCVDYLSCYSIEIHLPDYGDASINCDDSSNSSWWGACEWIEIHEGIATENVEVLCGKQWECYYGDLMLANVLSLTVQFDHWYSGFAVYVYGANITSGLTVLCKDTNACLYIDVMCPESSQCYVGCYGESSCRGMEFVIESNDYSLLNASCTPYSGDNITSEWSCFEYSYVTCTDTGAHSELSYNIWDKELSCHAACCPFEIEEMLCDIGTDGIGGNCVVDCTARKCEGHLINATYSNSINVICANNTISSSCDGLAIYCPLDGECNIMCDLRYGCNAMYIVSESPHSDVTVACLADDSCYHLSVNAPNANSITINAMAWWALYDATVHAESADLNLTCQLDFDRSSWSVCVYSTLYVSTESDNAVNLNCYGNACSGLSFYAKEGMDNANVALNLDAYGSCPCGNWEQCIYWLRFVCGENYDDSSMFYGYYWADGCSNDTCGCTQFMTMVEDNYVYDNGSDSCVNTTNSESLPNNGKGSDNGSTGTIVGVVIGIVVITGLCVIGYWYFVKVRKEKKQVRNVGIEIAGNDIDTNEYSPAIVNDGNALSQGGYDMTALNTQHNKGDITPPPITADGGLENTALNKHDQTR